MQSNKRTKRKINYGAFLLLFAILCVIVIAIVLLTKKDEELPAGTATSQPKTTTAITEPPVTTPTVSYAARIGSTVTLTTGTCANSILIDADNNVILAERDSEAQIYPASMTKMMTLLVAVESGRNMTDPFTMTSYIIDPLVSASASMAGFAPNESVTFQDLLYGCSLPSGADATAALAIMVAGSEVQFVNLMNQKALEIGMKNTHFMNESGLHDVNHYSTVQDIALLLQYTLKNPICKAILSAKQYTTTKTAQNPEGLLLHSTIFSRLNGTEVPGVTVLGGKTGFTDEAGNCLASFAEQNGHTYLAVVAGGTDRQSPITDTLTLYSNYLQYTPGTPVTSYTGAPNTTPPKE